MAHSVEEPLHIESSRLLYLFRFFQNGIHSGHPHDFREPSEFLLELANLDLERQNTLKNSIPEKGLCIVI
jgi:hypothetical protein